MRKWTVRLQFDVTDQEATADTGDEFVLTKLHKLLEPLDVKDVQIGVFDVEEEEGVERV